MGVVEPDPAPERFREASPKRARLRVQERGHDEIEAQKRASQIGRNILNRMAELGMPAHSGRSSCSGRLMQQGP